jgi:hypothetical protein
MAFQDVLNAFLGRGPSDFFSAGAKSELFAGLTWYDWAFGKRAEKYACPAFLGSLGYVLTCPVDLPIFVYALVARTLASSANYASQLHTLGFGFRTAFVRNPAIEETFFGGYWQDAQIQHVAKSQAGTFNSTVGGSGDSVPEYNSRQVQQFMTLSAASLGVAAAHVFLGGIEQLKYPFGLGVDLNVFFGVYSGYLSIKALSYIKRAGEKDAKQVDMAGFRAKYPFDYSRFASVRDLINNSGRALSYDTLFLQREKLKSVLQSIDAMDKTGRPLIRFSNECRNVANSMLELYTGIEMLILSKSMAEPLCPEARLAIKVLGETTKEPVVVKESIGLFTDLGLKR